MSSFARSLLVRGTGLVTYKSAFFFTRDAINLRHLPGWATVGTSMFGPIDMYRNETVIKIPLRLWGAYENLSILFPSYLMNPIPGTSVFGTSSTALTVQGRNNDLITYTNAQITKLANLYLGVDSDLFAADVEVSCILGATNNPEDAGAYHTRGTNAYSDATAGFAKTNYVKTRFTGAWGAITGFGAIVPQKGAQISWDAQLAPVMVDGFGTVDMTVKSMIARATCIPLGPTLAQLKTNSQEEATLGTLASAISADLAWTGNNSGPVVTLKGAYLKENGIVFDQEQLRIGEATWETTRGFTTGAPAVVASVA